MPARCEVALSGLRTPPPPPTLQYMQDKNMLAHTNESVFERVLGVKGSGGYGRTLSFRQPKKPPAQVSG
eukprot:119216-Pelagomonas_calceolata.AAC.3